MENNKQLLTELKKMKGLMNYLDGIIKENVRHIKVTYGENGEVVKKEALFLDKPYNIKGKNYNDEIRELNLGANQEVYPSNK